MPAAGQWVNAMGDEEKSIVETITEDIAEAAKAVLAEIKSVATEVTEAVESAAALCDEESSPKDGAPETGKSSDETR
jgi:hypothetical protein